MQLAFAKSVPLRQVRNNLRIKCQIPVSRARNWLGEHMVFHGDSICLLHYILFFSMDASYYWRSDEKSALSTA
jgi:hypothetical protein